jgi:pimeloyl-ACP methyl ester carboxylesterase
MVHPDWHRPRSGPRGDGGASTAASFRNQVEALLGRPDARAVLATIRCPALVLCGREDGWSPLEQHEEIAAVIEGSRLAVIDACGHMAPFERPAEVSRALEDWLE